MNQPTTQNPQLLKIWADAQNLIKEHVGITSYETWFSSLNAEAPEADTLIIQAPDEFFKTWIVEHYLSIIEESVEKLSSGNIKIDFHVNTDLLKINSANKAKLSEFEKSFQPIGNQQPKINPRFTFDNFVIGPSNRFCYAASMAVAESPAKAYNPLFIYGKVGLGKTHLMQAITHKIRENHPAVKICYISSERFTNELIDSIRNRTTAQFRQKYRNIDVLLIDDVHFIAGKESTQEEFFHTFNTLHDNRKQIIISSDRPPKEISNLEERLSSRFAWGLITDISPPDFETRVAILKKKVEYEPVTVPDDVINFIATEVKTNIRELEGALIRVVAYSLLEDDQINLDMAKVVLKDMVKETMKTISVEAIQKSVSQFFKISLADLRAKRRSRNLVVPRQVAMYLSRQLTTMSLPEIGNAFGGKDHTTVLHSCRKIDKNMNEDRGLKNIIEQLTISLTE